MYYQWTFYKTILSMGRGVTVHSKLLVTLKNPNSIMSEHYRKIRTNIEFSSIDHKYKLINITSSVEGESKSTTACNLAIMFANKYKRVLLVDADLRRPTVHRLMGMKIGTGLTELVLEYAKDDQGFSNIDLSNYIQTFEHDNIVNQLDILNAGGKVINPAEFINSQSFADVLKGLTNYYDVVIVDSAPCGMLSDGVVVSTIADGTLFIVEYGQTKYETVKNTIKQLRYAGVNLIGGILSRTPSWSDGYGYYYNYGTYYDDNQGVNKDDRNQKR